MGARSERGSSLAWTAAFLAAVLLPMLLLVVDGTRLFFVRGRLQTATDAACAGAAWAAGDRRHFLASGEARLVDSWYINAVAQNAFTSTLMEAGQLPYDPLLSISLDAPGQQVICASNARVPILFWHILSGPMVQIRAQVIATFRYR
jgi:uncharacterized membrane protein